MFVLKYEPHDRGIFLHAGAVTRMVLKAPSEAIQYGRHLTICICPCDFLVSLAPFRSLLKDGQTFKCHATQVSHVLRSHLGSF